MKRFLIPVFIALIVSSCATVEGYKKTLQTWIGSSEGALIQSWGPPSSVYVSGGVNILLITSPGVGMSPAHLRTTQQHLLEIQRIQPVRVVRRGSLIRSCERRHSPYLTTLLSPTDLKATTVLQKLQRQRAGAE